MAPIDQIRAFANSVYLIIKNRHYDDLTSTDGQAYILAVIDFFNQFLDELDYETDDLGNAIDWNWYRQLDYTLGVAVQGSRTLIPTTSIFNLIADQNRYVQILQDGTAVSNWAVVAPTEITNRNDRITLDMVTFVNGQLVFSRELKDYEAGGTVTGDVTVAVPRLSLTNAKALSIIKPKSLLILGVAKNSSLPDIVKGNLSPSYVQKYTDLLKGVKARNVATAVADTSQRESFGYVRGVGF